MATDPHVAMPPPLSRVSTSLAQSNQTTQSTQTTVLADTQPPFYILFSHRTSPDDAPILGHPKIEYHYSDDSPLHLLPQTPNEHVVVLDYQPATYNQPALFSSSGTIVSPSTVVSPVAVHSTPIEPTALPLATHSPSSVETRASPHSHASPPSRTLTRSRSSSYNMSPQRPYTVATSAVSAPLSAVSVPSASTVISNSSSNVTVRSLSSALAVIGVMVDEAPGAAAADDGRTRRNDRMYVLETAFTAAGNASGTSGTDASESRLKTPERVLAQFRQRNTVLREASRANGEPQLNGDTHAQDTHTHDTHSTPVQEVQSSPTWTTHSSPARDVHSSPTRATQSPPIRQMHTPPSRNAHSPIIPARPASGAHHYAVGPGLSAALDLDLIEGISDNLTGTSNVY
ncbi:hypothetical protein FISHEDRAFT_61149 [Fistulina hepatica ATCC 64428]|uniref:Uncharacterized protein n=1 Tax=Fistulina hepatica ATCC 64428 TaxID=1128425 RepID=A0A0D7A4X5_9AGAR|nr:hypothetical protein FISHEDRAFT_61149 [Fistulina hepatica ATCC 64428]